MDFLLLLLLLVFTKFIRNQVNESFWVGILRRMVKEEKQQQQQQQQQSEQVIKQTLCFHLRKPNK